MYVWSFFCQKWRTIPNFLQFSFRKKVFFTPDGHRYFSHDKKMWRFWDSEKFTFSTCLREPELKKETFECQQCGKLFSWKKSLNHHMRTHEDSSFRYLCLVFCVESMGLCIGTYFLRLSCERCCVGTVYSMYLEWFIADPQPFFLRIPTQDSDHTLEA